MAGYLGSGYSMIGNPFTARDISEIILEPVEGFTAYKWNNISNRYDMASYEFGEWPVQTAGYSPQCAINRMINDSGDYQTCTLTTNNVWQTGGTNTVVPLNLTEGFWISKPASATWSFSVPIW